MSNTKPTMHEGKNQLVEASTRRPLEKEEIKVLLIKDQTPQTVVSVYMSSSYRRIDILYEIFTNHHILHDILGSKDIMANQSLIKLTSLKKNHQYILEAITPSVNYKICISPGNNSSYHYSVEINSPGMKRHQFNYFENMFNSEAFSDVILCVSDKELFAHKIILANRSPVFSVLLDRNVNRFEIKDISYDTLYSLVHFIYKGVSCNNGSNDQVFEYANLLIADALYVVEGLKEFCEEKLSLLLTPENAIDCLILADANGAVNLAQQAITFITNNAEQIIELASFRKLAMLQHDKLMKVLKSAIKNRK